METYRIQLELRSPLVTPVQGDTLFGHVCWGMAYHEGEAALARFLCAFDDGEIPLVISNGFPHDQLPMPILNHVVPEQTDLGKIQELKELKSRRFVPKKLFWDSSFRFSPDELIHQLQGGEKGRGVFRRSHHIHNTINRGSGMVREGGLYMVIEDFPTSQTAILDVYLTSTLSEARISQLFHWALESGYGADKSTGKGVLEIFSIEQQMFPRDGNRCMALGNFVPAPDEQLSELRADILTKFGKLGGHFVTSRNPFKKPILMYQAGSTFESQDSKPFVGTLLGNVHKDPKIRHHALAPVIRYREEVTQ